MPRYRLVYDPREPGATYPSLEATSEDVRARFYYYMALAESTVGRYVRGDDGSAYRIDLAVTLVPATPEELQAAHEAEDPFDEELATLYGEDHVRG